MDGIGEITFLLIVIIFGTPFLEYYLIRLANFTKKKIYWYLAIIFAMPLVLIVLSFFLALFF